MPLIPELYAKPVITASEEIRRLQQHYEKALDGAGIDKDNCRQYADILQRKGGTVILRIVSTFKLRTDPNSL